MHRLVSDIPVGGGVGPIAASGSGLVAATNAGAMSTARGRASKRVADLVTCVPNG